MAAPKCPSTGAFALLSSRLVDSCPFMYTFPRKPPSIVTAMAGIRNIGVKMTTMINLSITNTVISTSTCEVPDIPLSTVCKTRICERREERMSCLMALPVCISSVQRVMIRAVGVLSSHLNAALSTRFHENTVRELPECRAEDGLD